jgi:hypothetical protein
MGSMFDTTPFGAMVRRKRIAMFRKAWERTGEPAYVRAYQSVISRYDTDREAMRGRKR